MVNKKGSEESKVDLDGNKLRGKKLSGSCRNRKKKREKRRANNRMMQKRVPGIGLLIGNGKKA